jgi:L-lactate utilization protein LutC
MEHEDPVPVEPAGLVFHVESSAITGASLAGKVGQVRLRAEFTDEELWKGVVNRLNGYRVHAVEDFHAQLLTVLRNNNAELERKLAKVTEEKRQGDIISAQSLEWASRRLTELETENATLKAKLAIHEEADRELEALLNQHGG